MDTLFENLQNHPFQWAFVAIFIVGMIYAAHVIKNEKKTYLETATPLSFKHYDFRIPTWWTNTSKDEEILVFERTDTYYDWKAHFRWLPFNDGDEDKDLKTAFAELIKDKNIVFDSDTSVIKNPSDFIGHQIFKDIEADMIRVEGTATQELQHRIYYDAFLIRDKGEKGFSSVKAEVLF